MKPILALDLDGTLIHSLKKHQVTRTVRRKTRRLRRHHFDDWVVYERPHLRDFLIWAKNTFISEFGPVETVNMSLKSPPSGRLHSISTGVRMKIRYLTTFSEKTKIYVF